MHGNADVITGLQEAIAIEATVDPAVTAAVAQDSQPTTTATVTETAITTEVREVTVTEAVGPGDASVLPAVELTTVAVAKAPPAAAGDSEVFAAAAQVVSSTANADDGTIDVVWYSGATVPRIDRSTGDPYMLRLAMEGCRMDRLNAGAPVFDTHFTGDDYRSIMAGKVGTRAQVGVVQRAWPNGPKGMATLKFDLGDPDGAEMFRKASTGILQNLSFGTFIYQREKSDMQTEGMPGGKPPSVNNQEMEIFTATDWEPFEISPCTVPADFDTCFLNAQPNGEMTVFGVPDAAVMEALRAISPQKETPAMADTTQQASGVDAARVVNEQALTAARNEAVVAERLRVSEITSLGATVKPYGIDGPTLVSKFIQDGLSVEDARTQMFAAMKVKGEKTTEDTVKAHNDIKQIYGVDIPQNSGTIKQVVSMAQSQFGGDIAVAVRSPGVRQLVMLYSEATGQKMPLSASTPYAGSLAEQGGNLYQQASFANNAFHSYASNLPTLGGNGGTTFPTTPGPNTSSGNGTYLSLSINGQPITADFVADQSMAAQNASYGRTQQSANLQVPGLMVA